MEETEEEVRYWKIWYVSCESNRRWTIAKAPIDWEEWQVKDRIPMGGCGDDVAEIISVEETWVSQEDRHSYSWDFTS